MERSGHTFINRRGKIRCITSATNESSQPYSRALERDTRSSVWCKSQDSLSTSGWEFWIQVLNDRRFRMILESGASSEVYVRIRITSSSVSNWYYTSVLSLARELKYMFLPYSLSLSSIFLLIILREWTGSTSFCSSCRLEWCASGRWVASFESRVRRSFSSTESSSWRYRSTLVRRKPYFLAMRKASSLLIKAASWG